MKRKLNDVDICNNYIAALSGLIEVWHDGLKYRTDKQKTVVKHMAKVYKQINKTLKKKAKE